MLRCRRGATPRLHSHKLARHRPAAARGTHLMRLLVKLTVIVLVILIFAIPVLVVAGALLAIDSQPSLDRNAEIKPENIARAKRILERNDPRKLRPGALRTMQIGAEELDLGLNYLANRHARGRAAVVLQEGSASVRASLALPANPLGSFGNINAVMLEGAGLPTVEQLMIGRLPVPSFVANRLLRWALEKARTRTAVSAATDAVKRVAMRGGSGFSFNDIAADRAGVRLGELATASMVGARKLQRAAATRLGAADLLPEVKDLPEFMEEAEFKRRYGGVGAPEYKKMMAEIERRVAALAILRRSVQQFSRQDAALK